MTLCTGAQQAPLYMGFFRQKYWSELPCPPAGNLPNPRIKLTSPMSPALADGFFTANATLETPRNGTNDIRFAQLSFFY